MNSVKEKLKSGGFTIGSWMQIPNTSIAEILGSAGFDWIALDLEHGVFGLDLLPDIFRAIKIGGSLPFARVAQNHLKDIKQALDAGAKGIVVPMIETAEQVEDFLKWSSYPPDGTRGVGYSNANLFGKYFDSDSKKTNSDLVRVIQIENIKAIQQIDSILSIKGIDAMMIGPYDLSGSMGLTGQFEHPDFLAAIEALKKAAERNGIPLGTHVIQADFQKVKDEIQAGKKFIAYSTDAIMLNTQASLNFKELK
ncbi:HpcH/HpaI aldolase family protein [Leptospira mayottensis]|uniref:HpcH/HpaI aldolase family protein n=1 Tax=Leptospira mayottensis TaxID=1137606 RepID=UPI0002BD36C2|nr:aldolase/citrate lyase family protein [Leptospira mayottensis]AXR61704.1 2,4-dihydroxyhept-2-ene-1,7-dioic acid aldolase [Leptospira mayottensis]AZQ01849.1 2,4-dihydroxyhept-2-ene-1,7-dioic acid aldolase [Leptospira mayottensis 200901116]TGN16828.1 2,4-dihydroxyhept-2-ene-1,7-dioic acid aldolase [Leptospira mayottensis]